MCAPWLKATVKSPVGACIFTLYFLLPWTPCPALFRIYLLLPGTGGRSYTRNGQCFFFLLLPGTGGGSYTGNGQCFFFLLLPGTGGGSYTGNFFSFCCQGQEEEVTQGTLLLIFPPWEVLRLWIPWQLEVESGSMVRLWPGWMKRPSGWMDDGSGGRSQGLLHQKPSYID